MKRHTETRTFAKELRRNLTQAERKLWRILRANRLGVKFQKQVALPPYIADFAARSERLVIEIDGDTHGDREAYDAARTAALGRMGYRVIRFTNNDVLTNLSEVVLAIFRELGRDPQLPRPLLGERDSRSGAEAGSGGRLV
jgi:very-short-patch-repair endonuclease